MSSITAGDRNRPEDGGRKEESEMQYENSLNAATFSNFLYIKICGLSTVNALKFFD